MTQREIADGRDPSPARHACNPQDPVALGRMRLWERIALTLAIAGIGGLAVQALHARIFGWFHPWDDEGYFMLSIHELLDGHRLYDEVRIWYGPVYFGWKVLLHGVLGLPLTHDVVRLTALSTGLATASLSAWLALRLTGDPVLAVLALYTMTVDQSYLVTEPGHPQELAVLLTVALPLVATFIRPARPGPTVAALAFLVAGLALVKVNLGALAGLAVWMALVASATPSWWLRTASLGAALAFPFGLLSGAVGQNWVAFGGLVSAWVVTLAGPLLRGRGSLRLIHLAQLVLGVAAGVLSIVLVTVLFGTSLRALLDCLVVYPQGIARYFYRAPSLPEWAKWLAGGGVTLSLVWTWLGPTLASRAPITTGVVGAGRLLFGLYVLGNLVQGHVDVVSAYAPSFAAWLILLPVPEPRGERLWPAQLPRQLLAWLAVLAPLQIYPLPGSQVVCGSIPGVLCGLTCLGDGAAWLGALIPSSLRRRVCVATAAAVLVATVLLARANAAHWRSVREDMMLPLDLPGATRIRTLVPVAQTLQDLVHELDTGCASYAVLPGLQSLYFWTSQPVPNLVPIPQDTRLLRSDDIAAFEHALSLSPRPCLVKCPTAAQDASDPRVNELYRRATSPRAFGPCTVYNYRP